MHLSNFIKNKHSDNHIPVKIVPTRIFLIGIFFVLSVFFFFFIHKETKVYLNLVNEVGKKRLELQKILNNFILDRHDVLSLEVYKKKLIILVNESEIGKKNQRNKELLSSLDSWEKSGVSNPFDLTNFIQESEQLLIKVDFFVSYIEKKLAGQLSSYYFFGIIIYIFLCIASFFCWQFVREKKFKFEQKYISILKEHAMLLKMINLPLFSISNEGVFLQTNDYFNDMFDIKTSEIIGKHYEDMEVSKKQKNQLKSIIEKIKEGETLVSYPFRLIQKNKKRRYFVLNCLPSLDENSYIKSIFFIGYDLTDIETEKKTRENLLLKIRKLSQSKELIQHQERKKISYFIHDEMGQSLASLKILLNMKLSSQKNGEDRYMNKSISIVNTLISNVRQISRSLRPPELDVLGVIETIKHYLDQQQAINSSVKFYININIPEKKANDIDEFIFRATQELVTNAIRHSNATEIDVSLFLINKKIVLTVKDNGVGFSLAEIENVKGVGLLGIKERLYTCNGNLQTQACFPGTKVIVSFPIYN